jgi:hypothetical protein
MEFQTVAPESFIAKRVESERLAALFHEHARILLNDGIERTTVLAAFVALAHEYEWQTRQDHSRRNPE